MAPDRVLPPLLAVLARVALEIAREEAQQLTLVMVAEGIGGGEPVAITVEDGDCYGSRNVPTNLVPFPLPAPRMPGPTVREENA